MNTIMIEEYKYVQFFIVHLKLNIMLNYTANQEATNGFTIVNSYFKHHTS